MVLTVILVVVVIFVLSFAITGIVRRIATRHNLMDLPNDRSSHAVATPRGGGLGIVVSFTLATGVLWAMDLVPGQIWFLLALSGILIAGVGYLDDRYKVKASVRLIVHICAAIIFVSGTGGYPFTELNRWGLGGEWVGPMFSILVLVWGTNLFNFMDGIDGIAGSESVFFATAGGILNAINGGDIGLTSVLFSLSAASLGFLGWNWPPARIFMGDVGSGFLGFIISACLMLATIRGTLPVEVLPILGGIFFVDATTTLIRRIIQGDRWFEPHRTHAYQWMARRYRGHRPVTLGILGVNVIWLFPWAAVATYHPARARLCMAVALVPLVIVSIIVGAGRRETKTAA
jgi:Fuc2NAc and GlcNAc transferase